MWGESTVGRWLWADPPRKRFHEMTSHENDVANYRLRGQGQFRRSLGLLRVIDNITVIMPLGQELFAEIKKIYVSAFYRFYTLIWWN